MKMLKLQNEQRRFFDDSGYLVVPNVLTPNEIEVLTGISNRIIEDFIQQEKPNQCRKHFQCRTGIVEEPTFHPLLAHSSTLPLVIQLLSPNIHLHTSAVIYKYPEPDQSEAAESRGWHRDIGMTEDLGHENIIRAGIKVGYCLTDFPEPRSGFTMFAPGSHQLTTPLPIPTGACDPENAVDLCLKAGDAFLFENRLFHTAVPNFSSRTSKVIILGYSYRWMGGPGDNMKLVQPGIDVLEQVDGIRKQLLGASTNALSEWAQENNIAPKPLVWTMEG